MNITPINSFNTGNAGYVNIKKPHTMLNKSPQMLNLPDTITFLGDTQKYKYSKSWYLKDETILAQDNFSTTIEDKTAKKGLLDNFLKKTHPKKLYDLPLRLREDMAAKGTDTVILKMPEDVLNASGLSSEEFIKSINKINALIALVYPRYDAFEDETKQSFKMQMGNSVANVTRLTQGLSGIIYKIEVEGCKPLALKHYLRPNNVNLSEGAFPEVAIAKKMNEDNVKDIPLLYCANPYDGWMLSEFIDKDYETRKEGIGILDYAIANELAFDDNTGIAVLGKDGLIFVDFGYISSRFSHLSAPGFREIVAADNKLKVNSDGYKDSKHISLLGMCENVNLYAKFDNRKEFVNKHTNDPEYRLFDDILAGVKLALAGAPMPKGLKESLQETYEKSGFIGDAVQLVESCAQ